MDQKQMDSWYINDTRIKENKRVDVFEYDALSIINTSLSFPFFK